MACNSGSQAWLPLELPEENWHLPMPRPHEQLHQKFWDPGNFNTQPIQKHTIPIDPWVKYFTIPILQMRQGTQRDWVCYVPLRGYFSFPKPGHYLTPGAGSVKYVYFSLQSRACSFLFLWADKLTPVRCSINVYSKAKQSKEGGGSYILIFQFSGFILPNKPG